MSSVLKSRTASLLLILIVMVFTVAQARAADVPLRKALTAPSAGREVVPLHPPHPISRMEIFQAIQDELERRGIAKRGEFYPGDLIIQSSVPVLTADLGLKVKRIGFDPLRRVIVFKLWASHEPQYLPFDVTTHRDPQSLGLDSVLVTGPPGAVGGSPRAESLATGLGGVQPLSKAVVLAKPGTPATLIMFGQNVRITTTAVPLQPGSKGQCILVRESSTARVMKAEVVAEGLLETSF